MTIAGETKIIVSLWAAPQFSKEEFSRGFADTARQPRTPAEGRQRWSLLIDRTSAVPLPHEAFMRNSPAPGDATVHLTLGTHGADPTSAVRSVLDRLAPFVDPKATQVLVCTEITIVPGYAPVFVMMSNSRLENMTHEDFINAWYGRHADLGVSSGVARYRQQHVDPET